MAGFGKDEEKVPPVSFELAGGDKVLIIVDLFWKKMTISERAEGVKAWRYVAIRVYSDEGTYPRRMGLVFEFRDGKDFNSENCSRIWRWLRDHAESRLRFSHDDVGEFVAAFGRAIEQIEAEDEDMVEHLQKLPFLTLPEAFDRYDDSIFNDQEDQQL